MQLNTEAIKRKKKYDTYVIKSYMHANAFDLGRIYNTSAFSFYCKILLLLVIVYQLLFLNKSNRTCQSSVVLLRNKKMKWYQPGEAPIARLEKERSGGGDYCIHKEAPADSLALAVPASPSRSRVSCFCIAIWRCLWLSVIWCSSSYSLGYF